MNLDYFLSIIPNFLKKEVARPLSFSEMKSKLPDVNIIEYTNLDQYNDIQEALGSQGACIILYMESRNYGHWVLLMKKNNNTLEFFDSYGIILDDEFKFINYESGAQVQNLHYLTYLILKSGFSYVICNTTKLQQDDKNKIQTCGRWVLARFLLREMNIQDFNQLFNMVNDKVKDIFVTLLTLQ